MKIILENLKTIGLEQSGPLYKFIEVNYPLLQYLVPVLKVVAPIFLVVFVVMTCLAPFVDPNRQLWMNLYNNFNSVKEYLLNNSLGNYFRPVNSANISPDLDRVAELFCEAYGKGRSPKKRFRELLEDWYKGNSDVIGLIINPDEHEIVGFVLILPLKQATGSSNFNGYIRAGNISREAIAGKGQAKFIRIQSIYLQRDYQDEIRYAAAIVRLTLTTIGKMIKSKVTVVFAEPDSKYGTKVLELFGLQNLEKTSKRKHAILAINQSESNTLPPEAHRTIELFKLVTGK